MDIDFNRLKIFYFIFSEKSIVKAAKKLHLSQPAVSQHLQKLEKEMKTKLFTRIHRQLVPTTSGKSLFKILKPFVQELYQQVASIKMESEIPSGKIKIGVPYEFGRKYMPVICNDFRKIYPDVNFVLTFVDPVTPMPLLRDGTFDFAIVDIPSFRKKQFSSEKGYHLEVLMEEELILACSNSYYKDVLQHDFSFANIISKSFISDEYDALILEEWFKYHFKKKVSNLNTVMASNSHQAVISCIQLGMGLGITATHLVTHEIEKGEIIPIPTKKRHLLNRISLIYLRDKFPTLTEKTFQKFLKKKILECAFL